GYALWHNNVHGFDQLRRRHLVPEPPYGQGAVAAHAGAGAMIDVSDGLVADLRHIADASSVSIELSTAALAADRDGVLEAARAVGPDAWGVIGTVVDGPPCVLVDGGEWGGSAGWQSFG